MVAHSHPHTLTLALTHPQSGGLLINYKFFGETVQPSAKGCFQLITSEVFFRNQPKKKVQRKLSIIHKKDITKATFYYCQSLSEAYVLCMGCGVFKASVVSSRRYTTASSTTQSVPKFLVQNYLLIYVDESVDQYNKDCQKTLAELRNVINDIVICKEPAQCLKYLNEINDGKACVISSGTMGQSLVPEIHAVPIIDSIYIFCSDKTIHEEWVKEWSKVQGIFTSIQEICESLKIACRQIDHDAIPMSFIQKELVTELTASSEEKNLNQLPPAYMYSCIFKGIIFEINEDETKAIQRFIIYCQRENIQNSDLQNFKKEYKKKSAVWWYTSQTFLYTMLNHALRALDIGAMTNMSFFIRNLHRELGRLYEKQSNSNKAYTVYLGRGLSPEDFQDLLDTEGGLLALNTFVMASTDRFVAMGFITESLRKHANNVGVLFIIKIDPRSVSASKAPFAFIDHDSNTKTDREVLFSMNTVFRVGKLKQAANTSNLWELKLTLTDDNDSQLTKLTEYLEKEIEGEGWYRMGQFMLKMGHFDQAELVYDELLENNTNDSDRAYIYHHIGYLKEKQGKPKEAASYFEKSLELKRKLHANDLSSAATYHNIASMHHERGEYSKALEFYQKSNTILEKCLPSSDPVLASSYNGIGLVHKDMGDYSKALLFYEKSLKIQEKALPSNHPSLGMSYNNIADLYQHLGDYTVALEFFEKSIEISEKSLPPNHPDLAISYSNIGLLYDKMCNYSKALQLLEKSLKIREKTLPANHPDLALCYNNIGLVYSHMGDMQKGLEFFTKAVKIFEKALPSNHPTLATLYCNVGLLYESLSEYPTALSFLEKSLKIREEALPTNHPDFAQSYNNIGLVYSSMGEHSKALRFYEKSLKLQEEVLPSNHPDLVTSYKNIGVLYMETGQNAKALQFLRKSLAIAQVSLSPTDPSIQDTLNAINSLKDEI